MKTILILILIPLLACMACDKEPSNDNQTTLRVEIVPIPNREHVMPVCIIHYGAIRDTFQYILIEEMDFSFEYIIPSKHYEFKYTLDTFHNVKEFRLYEENELLETVSQQGELIYISK